MLALCWPGMNSNIYDKLLDSWLYIRSTDITNDLCPVISCMRVLLTEDSNNTKSNSFLLDDNSRRIGMRSE
ncbi:hypothetical protein P3S68_029387 [Capsicum galapagoense]